MAQASIIINVSDRPQSHSNGLSGSYTVPPKPDGKEFGLLVVYPGREIQDLGDKRKEVHYPKAKKIAQDIIGFGSDAAAHTMGAPGTKEKWGLLLCAAEPDVPRELDDAIEEEGGFLDANPPDVKQKLDPINKINVAVNIEPDSVKEEKIKLSNKVQKLRQKFEASCAALVSKEEVARAKRNMQIEDQRLVAEGDALYAKGEMSRNDIGELHKGACIRLGQERPWCYVPLQMVDCPGCGGKIKENVLFCSHCQGRLFDGIEILRDMAPAKRAVAMYPDMITEPMGATGKPARS